MVPSANSCICNFPRIMAPASVRSIVTLASYSGMKFLYISDPIVVGTSFVKYRSLSPMGIPCRSPFRFPDKISFSAWIADLMAVSSRTVIKELSLLSVSFILV